MGKPVFSFEGTCDVETAVGDTEPFRKGCRFEIQRTALGLVLRVAGREHPAREKSETHAQCVDSASRWFLWVERRGEKTRLLGTVLREDRGEDATGVWIAEAGEGAGPNV